MSYVINMCNNMKTVQDKITAVLDVPAENAMEAELIESQLESCERAYIHVGKKGRR